MQIYSEDKQNYTKLIDDIGLFFQIRDDLANLCSKEYADSKSFCEDLTEGKFSYPIIHSIRYNSVENKEKIEKLMSILKERTNDINRKQEAIRILQTNGSFEFTIKILQQIKSDIFDELKTFNNGNPYLEKLLVELCKIIETTGDEQTSPS
jgi:geranylgeranyl diphosphate synthase, type III